MYGPEFYEKMNLELERAALYLKAKKARLFLVYQLLQQIHDKGHTLFFIGKFSFDKRLNAV